MKSTFSENRMVWLTVGLVAGLCLSYFWPHEPAQAVTTDRNSKFAMITTSVAFPEAVEGVFVLDFLTGTLRGGVINNRTGGFTHHYARNIAADFNVDPSIEPQYAIVSGRASLPGRGGVTPASGVIYIAELTSGKVACYSYPYRETNRPLPMMSLVPIDGFQFREALD